MISTTIRRMGNSQGVILPKAILSDLGLQAGDTMSLVLEDGCIVLKPVAVHPRAGWAEAAAAIAAAHDDAPAWPEFPNADDADLVW